MKKDLQVLEKLKTIIDPDLGKDIVSLGFIKHLKIDDSGNVSFGLELTTPACPVKEKFKGDSIKVVSSLPWVNNVSVSFSSSKSQNHKAHNKKGLKSVKNILAVASCKGGVGKSTTAVNLAFSIAKRGAAVGIFDADIYGPSLATLINAEFNGLYQEKDQIIPVEYERVKLMSFAYASAGSGGGPAILRGPMVTQIINQLLTGTKWGELDYLIIDMPPGTGDTQLTLSQLIPMTGAVVVTTPQKLSFVDVIKGIQMFDKLKIPTVAVVENMSYFICDSCNKEHKIFGKGYRRRIEQEYGIKNSFALPLDQDVSLLSDSGTPIVICKPDSFISKKYSEIADSVIREISKIVFSNAPKPKVSVDQNRNILYTSQTGKVSVIHPADLRGACRCAHCINEITGESMLEPSTIPESIKSERINEMGNYAITIAWSDGHSSIYPFEALEKIAGAPVASNRALNSI